MRMLKLWMLVVCLSWVGFACGDDGDSSTNDGDLDQDVTSEEELPPADEDSVVETDQDSENIEEIPELEEEIPDCDGTWLTTVSGTIQDNQGQPMDDAAGDCLHFQIPQRRILPQPGCH